MKGTISNKRQFDAVWIRLAEKGRCDGFGGAEYRRVIEAWFRFGCPSQLPDFIVTHANVGSDGTGWEKLN